MMLQNHAVMLPLSKDVHPEDLYTLYVFSIQYSMSLCGFFLYDTLSSTRTSND